MIEVRAAVIGVGSMGRHHARIYSELPGVRLVGVSDVSEETGRRVAEEFHSTYFADYQKMLQQAQPEAVSVVVPTVHHLEVAKNVLKHVRVMLVEKPIAANESEAKRLIDLACSEGAILTVGQIERYNPAVQTIRKALEDGRIGRPIKINFRREGPDPERVRDVNVIEDIGIHDIDLAHVFTKSNGLKLARVLAFGGTLNRKTLEDYANIYLTFRKDGEMNVPTLVDIHLSWVNRAKVRKIEVVGSSGYLTADLIRQQVNLLHTEIGPDFRDFENYQQLVLDQKVEWLTVTTGEPLKFELAEVVKAARGEPADLVDPREALDALRVSTMATSLIRAENLVLTGGER